jgi:hypothetical protein
MMARNKLNQPYSTAETGDAPGHAKSEQCGQQPQVVGVHVANSCRERDAVKPISSIVSCPLLGGRELSPTERGHPNGLFKHRATIRR